MALRRRGSGRREPVLLLHGEPSWGYLYRTWSGARRGGTARGRARPGRVRPLRQARPGRRLLLPAARRLAAAFVERLDLAGVTLFCQDWGSLIGLRVAAEQEHRFSRIVVANGFLPAGQGGGTAGVPAVAGVRPPHAGLPGREDRRRRDVAGAQLPRAGGVRRTVPVVAAQGRGRAFPALVPTTTATRPCPRTAPRGSGSGWEKPFLTLFGAQDPILGHADRPLQEHVPGAHGQPHARLPGSHFVQEDQGPELARRTVELVRSTPT